METHKLVLPILVFLGLVNLEFDIGVVLGTLAVEVGKHTVVVHHTELDMDHIVAVEVLGTEAEEVADMQASAEH